MLSWKLYNSPTAQQPAQPAQPTRLELEQVCTEFASIFFQALLKSMYSTIPKSTFCPEFQGKNLVNSIVDQGVAQYMALQDGAGLKEMLLSQINPAQSNACGNRPCGNGKE
ncbi:MAG: hypothetical protein AB1611_06750 [bacterium]